MIHTLLLQAWFAVSQGRKDQALVMLQVAHDLAVTYAPNNRLRRAYIVQAMERVKVLP